MDTQTDAPPRAEDALAPYAPASAVAEPARQQLGERIRTLRQARGLSREEVAADLGVHPNTLARIERGMREPGALQVRPLARLLECTVGELLGEGAPAAQPSDDTARRRALLQAAVEAVEVELQARTMSLPALQRARIYWAVYELSLPGAELVRPVIGPLIDVAASAAGAAEA